MKTAYDVFTPVRKGVNFQNLIWFLFSNHLLTENNSTVEGTFS